MQDAPWMRYEAMDDPGDDPPIVTGDDAARRAWRAGIAERFLTAAGLVPPLPNDGATDGVPPITTTDDTPHE